MEAGATYRITYRYGALSGQNLATLQTHLNGTVVGGTLSPVTTGWRTYSTDWASGGNTTLALALVNTNSSKSQGNDFAIDDIMVQKISDLQVTKDDGVTSVSNGNLTNYTVTVTNNGPSPVSGAILADPAATGMTKTAVACSATPGQCTPATTPSITSLQSGFALPNLAVGQSYQLRVTARITATSGNVTNVATVAAPAGVLDTDTTDNRGTDTNAVVTGSDLTITKTASAGSVPVGSSATFTIVATNNGPLAATGVTVSDLVPAGYDITAITVSTGSYTAPAGVPMPATAPYRVAQSAQLDWTIGALANGASATMTVVATVRPADPGAPNLHLNTATVASTSTDQNMNNNSGSASVTPLDPRGSLSALTCDAKLYQLYASNVSYFNLQNNSFPTVTTSNPKVGNAAGYRLSDNLVYYMSSGGVNAPKRLQVMGSNGQGIELGVIAGFPGVQTPAGDFDGDGYLNVRDQNGTVYRVDVDKLTVVDTYTTPGSPANLPDIAYNGSDGYFYTVDDQGQLWKFRRNPAPAGTNSSATVIMVGNIGLTGDDAMSYGAMFATAGGRIYGTPNKTGNIYEFNTTTGAATYVGSANLPVTNNDGFSCRNAVVLPNADMEVGKTNGITTLVSGAATTYTITVKNNGTATVNAPPLIDPAATGLTKTSVTCSATPGLCTTPPTIAQLEAGFALPNMAKDQTYQLLVTANVTAASGSVSNIATVTTPVTYYDSNAANNTATDTDTVTAPVPLIITKDSKPFSDPVNGTTNPKMIPGALVDYTISVNNPGPSIVTADSIIVTDPMPALVAMSTSTIGSGPIIFTANGTGLTFTFTSLGSTSDDVEFSNNNGSTWTYTPNGAIDPAVTHMRIKPKGVMAAGTTFNFTFRAQIK